MAGAAQTIGFTITRTFPAEPQRVWPLVSDTDAFNEAIGLPAWKFEERADALGGSVRIGSTRLLGTTVEWVEHPFDWVVGRGFRVQRDYSSGPLRSSVSELQLSPSIDGRTELLYTLEAEPRGALWKLLVRAELRRLEIVCGRVFGHIAAYLSGEATRPYPHPTPRLQKGGPELLAAVETTLPSSGHDRAIALRLADLLRTESDRNVARLNAVQLAEDWGVSSHALVRILFEASRLGALEPTWDMVCPLCRGAKHRLPATQRLPLRANCPACTSDYDVLLDETVELSFRPSPRLRLLENEVHCAGGPANTRHILAQQGVDVGASRELTVPLTPGLYRLRSARSAGSQVLTVRAQADTPAAPSPASPGRLDVRVDRTVLHTSSQELEAGDVHLRIENVGDVGQVVELERLDGPVSALTGLDAYRLRDVSDLLTSNIDCASFGVLVELAAAGTLDDDALDALDRHMTDCAACTARFADDREVLARLAMALERRDASPGPPFDDLLVRLF